MRRKALLEAVKTATLGEHVPYTQWGEGRHSWWPGIGQWITQVAGQRICNLDIDEDDSFIGVRDYNSLNLERARRDPDCEELLSGISGTTMLFVAYVDDDRFGTADFNRGLSFIQTRLEVKEADGIDDFMLDSERLIGIRVRHSTVSLFVRGSHKLILR